MSQGTTPVRPFARRTAGIALAALTLALAGCADPTKVAAPAVAAAAGSATDSAAVHGTVCGRIESAWAKFIPNGGFAVAVTETSSGRTYDVLRVDYHAYQKVSTGLYESLTGNREYQLTYDIDVLAAAAGDVYGDAGQISKATLDHTTFKKAAPLVAKDCGITLTVPA